VDREATADLVLGAAMALDRASRVQGFSALRHCRHARDVTVDVLWRLPSAPNGIDALPAAGA
jgi:lysylphosphatidylglycerol synthetase-like protein (DUF2156 family)